MKRLQELAAHRPQLYVTISTDKSLLTCSAQTSCTNDYLTVKFPCRYSGSGSAFDNIYVERDIASWEDLDQCLERAERLLQQPPGLPLRLIVIDSIAHIYRDAADFGSGKHTLS